MAPPSPGRTYSPELVFPAAEEETLAVTEFRLLRKRLLDLKPSRVILVTSALRGEGKSAVAANLALCYSEFGRARAMLVEANFARPSLANKFGVVPPACFAHQLVDRQYTGHRQPWRPAVLQTLAMLTVSPESMVKASAAWPAFQAMIGELCAEPYHDVIIIDGPPVLESADASIIAQQADQVVLVSLAGKSRTSQLIEAAERLAPARIAGAVLLQKDKTKKRR
jgi:Mrp family chromosome partitioning ATPase